MRDTNASRFLFHHNRVSAAAELVDAVAHSDECVRLVCQSGVSAAGLLDQAESELSNLSLRCVRIRGSASGGLALRDLITQVVGRANPDALRDCDLESGFVALTEPGEGYYRVVLLVGEAHNLQPSSVHYIQLACQSSPKLRVVLAGQPSLDAILDSDKFAYLRQRLTRTLKLPGPLSNPDPLPGSVPSLFSGAPQPAPAPATLPQDRSWSWGMLGAAVPMVVLLLLATGAMGWLHLPLPSRAATPANAPVPQLPAQHIQDAVTRGGPAMPAAREAPAAQPEAAGPAVLQASQSPVEAAPPRMADAPRLAEPAAAPEEHTEAAGKQAETASPATAPASQPIPAPEPIPAISIAEKADLAVKQDPASPGAASDALPPEKPIGATGDGAIVQDEPPVAVPMGQTMEPVPSAEPDAAQVPAPKAAQPLRASAIADGPPVPPRPQPRTAAVVILSPGASPARHLPPETERVAAPVAVLPVSSADERHCRNILLYAQLGKNLSDADKQFLRDDCHAQ